MGSDPSAASGRCSEGSEWPRSVSDAGIRAKESTGHRNRKRACFKPIMAIYNLIFIQV